MAETLECHPNLTHESDISFFYLKNSKTEIFQKTFQDGGAIQDGGFLTFNFQNGDINQ
jgi:hypothetical protein